MQAVLGHLVSLSAAELELCVLTQLSEEETPQLLVLPQWDATVGISHPAHHGLKNLKSPFLDWR